jgi:hypothetical protein
MVMILTMLDLTQKMLFVFFSRLALPVISKKRPWPYATR